MEDSPVASSKPIDGARGPEYVQQLEARYVELLEKRVASLEAALAQKDEADSKRRPTGRPSARNLTSNDRVEKFLANGEPRDKARRASNASSTGKSPKPSKIRFRDIKYNEEGVETPLDVSEKDSAKLDNSTKSKDHSDLIWTRRFDRNNRYEYSEVQLISDELQDVFRVVFAHDPRLHFSSDNKNEVTLTSPFEPLLHNWQKLEHLLDADCDSDTWIEIKGEVAKFRMVGTGPQYVDLDDRIAKAKEDLLALMNQVRVTPDMSSFLSGLETSKTSGTVQFTHLWTLFPPGELVYAAPFMKLDQVFIVMNSSSQIRTESDSGNERDQKKIWYLHCWSYDWNGKTFNRVPVAFKFEDFQGSRMINTLPCHPLQYHFSGEDANANLDALRKSLIARGKVYEDYCKRGSGAQMFEYQGGAISHGSGFQRLKNKSNQENRQDAWLESIFGRRRGARGAASKQSELRQFSGYHRVMVDFNSYIQHAPNVGIHAPMGDVLFSGRDDECRCGFCTTNVALRNNQRRDIDAWDPKKRFSDEQYLICPPRVLGYHLATRTWLELVVEQIIQIIQPESDAQFRRLQLAPTYKDLIQNLVQSHTSGSNKEPLMEDIVKGKGKGLVILLHGPPGVGKTLTAESVASMAGKPLFSVSPSDIGLDPADVEHNLESLFELAARWRAVLLFDEADVFLESRSAHNSDLTRNALVSVLLRVLEYYSGILILTTNRINQFDIAVQSRVNLGIKYVDLTPKQKTKIFQEFIDSVQDDKIEDRQEILNWFETDTDATEYFEPLNGRQVRNVLFSAASLALKDGECLKLGHIKTIAKSTFKFQESLKVVVQASRAKHEAGRYGD